jgi:hypothetical protein
MTVFDSRITTGAGRNRPRPERDQASRAQVGWVAALVWPLVWSLVLAGALLGAQGTLLFWLGVAGVLAMFARQGLRAVAARVRHANDVIDNAPGRIRG